MTREDAAGDPTANPEPVAGARPADGAPRQGADQPGFDGQTSATAAEAARAVAQAEDRLLRLAAEYDNFRKRTTKEKLEAFDRGAGALITRFLDVLDDIDRLAASDPATTSYDTFRGAFDLVQRKLAKELEAAGLERIDPVGQTFDPTVHEAVSAMAPERPEQDHTVKATFQTGYRFKGQVIRPARVQVYSSHGAS